MKFEPVGQAPCRIEAVLVVDDHPLYGEALCSALRHVFVEPRIETATSLGDALESVGAGFAPDLVLLDLKLPDVTGIHGLTRLRESMPDTPVLVISSLDSDDVVSAVRNAGAAGFVCKDAPMQTLKLALSEIRSGHKYYERCFSPRHCAMGPTPDAPVIGKRIAQLTPQQTRIMRLICAGKPNKQIAYEMSLAEATVKAHITALLRRLGVQNRTQAAVLVENAARGAHSGFGDEEQGAPTGR